jgi:hypothetical protein
MDNLDEGLIKLVNHKDHPTNKAYKVFFFYKRHEAEHFKTLLLKRIFTLNMQMRIIREGKYFCLG